MITNFPNQDEEIQNAIIHHITFTDYLPNYRRNIYTGDIFFGYAIKDEDLYIEPSYAGFETMNSDWGLYDAYDEETGMMEKVIKIGTFKVTDKYYVNIAGLELVYDKDQAHKLIGAIDYISKYGYIHKFIFDYVKDYKEGQEPDLDKINKLGEQLKTLEPFFKKQKVKINDILNEYADYEYEMQSTTDDDISYDNDSSDDWDDI